MKYTINEKFPNDDACLQYMFEQRFGIMSACPKCGVANPGYYRVRSKKAYKEKKPQCDFPWPLAAFAKHIVAVP
jgi:hypothetical protein